MRVSRKILWGTVALLAASTAAVSSAQGQPTSSDSDAVIQIPELFDLHVVDDRGIGTRATSPRPTGSWGLDRIDQADLPLNERFTYDNDGSGVKVYVVDTGIWRTHQEFGARVEQGFVAPLTGESTTEDCDGHGTHVAGTVGGSTYGVAKNVTIVPVRVFDCDGISEGPWLVQGINWIINDRAQSQNPGPAVVNLSLGSDEHSADIDNAVRALVADGVTVVVAAGNNNVYLDPANPRNPSPSCVTEAIVVGASDINDDEWYRNTEFGSSFGGCVDLFAPGDDIRSAWKDSDTALADSTGTSMSAPHVAGVAALILANSPDLTPAEVEQVILGAASVGKIRQATRGADQTLSPNKLLFACSSLCPPSAPRNVSVVRGGSGTVNVAWEAPSSNGGSSVTGYTATANPGGSTCSTTTSTSCVITNLANGTSYSVTLAATNAIGTSGASTAVSVVPATIPATPATPTVVAGDMNAAISWTAPDTGGSAITGYTVTASPGGATCTTKGELTCAVSGLANGTSYSFTVVATNEIGASGSSPASSVVMPAATWLAGPSGLRTTTSSKQVKVSWTGAQLSSGAPTGYAVRDKAGKTVCSAAGTATSCTVKKLKDGSSVVFNLVAISIANESGAVAAPKTVVGGLTQLANTLTRGKTYLLASIAKTGSKGKMTWSRVSGSCTISGQSVKAPTKRGTCKLKASVAKSAPYPAQKMTFTLTVK